MNFMMRNLFFHVDSECYEDLVIKIDLKENVRFWYVDVHVNTCKVNTCN